MGILPVETSLTIRDLRYVIIRMGAIRIYVDGVKLWGEDEDDRDCTDMTIQQINAAIHEWIDRRDAILSRQDPVAAVRFNVVDGSFTECFIETVNQDA